MCVDLMLSLNSFQNDSHAVDVMVHALLLIVECLIPLAVLYRARRADMATLNNDRLREKAEIGYLLCFDLPTKAMEGEIAAAGRYRHPLFDREYDRLQVVTVAELFAPLNRRLDLPMARDAVKAAAAVSDDGAQGALL